MYTIIYLYDVYNICVCIYIIIIIYVCTWNGPSTIIFIPSFVLGEETVSAPLVSASGPHSWDGGAHGPRCGKRHPWGSLTWHLRKKALTLEKNGDSMLNLYWFKGIKWWFNPIGSMYGIYANIWGILMVNVTIYSIHGSYGNGKTI
jgi:hypothetical protein